MRFLALYTGAQTGAPPSAEHMAKMGAHIQGQMRAGKLVSTGGLKSREKDGLRVRREGDRVTVEEGGAAWAAATGYAILEADPREALIADIKDFLGLAGDGVSELIEIPAVLKLNNVGEAGFAARPATLRNGPWITI